MRSKTVFSTFEAARICQVSPLSIINWVNAGRIPAFRTPGGHRRIRREDLVRFMRESGMPIPEELEADSARPRVLIVDDEPQICQMLAEYLSSLPDPYEVMTAADGFEAGRLVSSFRPDVVLLDLRMPGLDGFQVCRTIKSDARTARTVVIAMTGYYAPETEARILECGAARCVPKPVDPATLADMIHGYVNARRPATRRRR
jgi:excisionase family DNA binding protein